MKRKIVCGIALCLALSMAACGNTAPTQEQQAANYYKDELGLSEDDANELAHELYGEDNDVNTTEEEDEPIVVEPLQELLNSQWYEGKIQIYDMVFNNDMSMTADDIRRIAEASEYEVEIDEGFDKNGNVVIEKLVVNGTWFLLKHGNNGEDFGYLVENGLLEDGDYYLLDSKSYYNIKLAENCFDRSSLEFEELGTRDAILAYLSENGFVEIEENQALYRANDIEFSSEFVDTPHYFVFGAEQLYIYRMIKLNETDQEITYQGKSYSGGHMNLLDYLEIYFNADGTIQRVYHEDFRRYLVLGEQID